MSTCPKCGKDHGGTVGSTQGSNSLGKLKEELKVKTMAPGPSVIGPNWNDVIYPSSNVGWSPFIRAMSAGSNGGHWAADGQGINDYRYGTLLNGIVTSPDEAQKQRSPFELWSNVYSWILWLNSKGLNFGTHATIPEVRHAFLSAIRFVDVLRITREALGYAPIG